MSARSQIIDGIRRSLHRGELGGEARTAVDQRLAMPPQGPSVARAQLPQPEKVALFCQWAEANNATVARVAAAAPRRATRCRSPGLSPALPRPGPWS